MQELSAKLIDMAHANVDAVFDLAQEVASVQVPSELVPGSKRCHRKLYKVLEVWSVDKR